MSHSAKNWSLVAAFWLTGMAIWLCAIAGMGLAG